MDLPNRLWATTGVQIPNIRKYQSYGRLRNAIQHFTSPNLDASMEAIEFIYEVIDPFINHCWDLFAVDYNEDYEHPKYLVEGLIRRGVRFLVSPAVVEDIDKQNIDFEWPEKDMEYRRDMERRIEKAIERERRRNGKKD